MFDAFSRFMNGIISHESSNHGGGGRRGKSPGKNSDLDEHDEESAEELHLASDSLCVSKTARDSMMRLD